MSYHLEPNKLPIEKYTEVYANRHGHGLVVVRRFPKQGISFIHQTARGRRIAWDVRFKTFHKEFYKVGEL